MRTACKFLTVFIVAVSLSAGSGMPAGAAPIRPPVDSAVPVPAAARAQLAATYSRAFYVTNLSSLPLQLTTIQTGSKPSYYPHNGADDSTVGGGSVILPGESAGYHVTWIYGAVHTLTADFDILTGVGGVRIGSYRAQMIVTSDVFDTKQSSASSISRGQSTAVGNQLTVLDPPGTVVELPSRSARTAAIAKFCENGRAICSYGDVRTEEFVGPRTKLSGVIWNNGELPATKEISVSASATTTHEIAVGAELSATIFKVVAFTINFSYTYSWSKTETLTETNTLNIPPYSKGWFEGALAMVRLTGTVTVKMANTTWKLTDATVETPNPDGHATIILQTRPLTQQERDALDPGVGGNPRPPKLP